nr:hypothetical protein Itr_chr05CG14570 [Ipomoea trifida]
MPEKEGRRKKNKGKELLLPPSRSSHATAPLLLLLRRRRGNRGRNCCHLARRTPNMREREGRDLASQNRPHRPQLPPRPNAAAGERRTASLLRRLHRHCYSASSVTAATNGEKRDGRSSLLENRGCGCHCRAPPP